MNLFSTLFLFGFYSDVLRLLVNLTDPCLDHLCLVYLSVDEANYHDLQLYSFPHLFLVRVEIVTPSGKGAVFRDSHGTWFYAVRNRVASFLVNLLATMKGTHPFSNSRSRLVLLMHSA